MSLWLSSLTWFPASSHEIAPSLIHKMTYHVASNFKSCSPSLPKQSHTGRNIHILLTDALLSLKPDTASLFHFIDCACTSAKWKNAVMTERKKFIKRELFAGVLKAPLRWYRKVLHIHILPSKHWGKKKNPCSHVHYKYCHQVSQALGEFLKSCRRIKYNWFQ